MIAGLEDEDVLVLGFLVMEDLVHFEGHGLTRPHNGDLTEPAIWNCISVVNPDIPRLQNKNTFDGGVSDFSHCYDVSFSWSLERERAVSTIQATSVMGIVSKDLQSCKLGCVRLRIVY